MSKVTAPKIDVTARTVAVMNNLKSDRETLEISIGDIAQAIIADTAQGIACFKAARGLYLEVKGNGGAQSGVSDDWKRLTRALWNHFDRANLSVNWPNIRSGKGDFSLVAKEQASEQRKAKAVEKAEQDKADLAAFQQQQQQQQVKQIKAMSPEQMTAHLMQILTIWSDDAQNQNAVVSAVSAGVEKRMIAVADAAMKRQAKAAQSAAKAAAKRAKTATA